MVPTLRYLKFLKKNSDGSTPETPFTKFSRYLRWHWLFSPFSEFSLTEWSDSFCTYSFTAWSVRVWWYTSCRRNFSCSHDILWGSGLNTCGLNISNIQFSSSRWLILHESVLKHFSLAVQGFQRRGSGWCWPGFLPDFDSVTPNGQQWLSDIITVFLVSHRNQELAALVASFWHWLQILGRRHWTSAKLWKAPQATWSTTAQQGVPPCGFVTGKVVVMRPNWQPVPHAQISLLRTMPECAPHHMPTARSWPLTKDWSQNQKCWQGLASEHTAG